MLRLIFLACLLAYLPIYLYILLLWFIRALLYF